MKIVHTITIDGRNAQEFEQIKEHLEQLRLEHPEWELAQFPLAHRMTATRQLQVDSLPGA